MSATLQTQAKATPVTSSLTPARAGILQRKCACGGSPGLAGDCEECRNKRLTLQRYSANRAGPSKLMRSPPDSSNPSMRAAVEFGFGHNFGEVPVHTHVPHRIQTELAVSQPGDQYEQQADRVAELVMHVSEPSVTAGNQASPWSRTEPLIQRLPADEAPSSGRAATSPEAEIAQTRQPAPAQSAPETATPDETPSTGLIVEDDARELGPGQMKKSGFLDALQSAVCTAADAELTAVGRTAQGCPYIEQWIGYYRMRDSQHIEQAIRRYAPETTGVTSAQDYIPLVRERVRRGVARWATTGEITEVPEGVPTALPGTAPTESSGGTQASAGDIQFKERGGSAKDADPPAIQSRLGSGQSLEGGVKSRMESAFGHDFSRVRVHTDARAAELSSRLNARAFTIGSDVAFASREYQPATPIGDALIAHELAHVVQQEGTNAPSAPGQQAQTDANALEEDADLSAVGAVVGLWSRAKGALARFARHAMPSLRSGLRLSRCPAKVERLEVCIRPVQIAEDDGTNPTTLPSFASAQTIWGKCCIDLLVDPATTVSKTAFKVLDENSMSTTGTAEEQSLFAEAGSGGGCISVFVPQTFQDGSRISKDIAGGGHTFHPGTSDAKLVAVEGIEPSIIAHELGHAMGYSFAQGINAHRPAGTVMEPSRAHNKPVPYQVAAVICNQVRKFVNARSVGGEKDCKMRV